MKRPSFRAAVEYIALNDNPGDSDGPEALASYISVQLVADLWGVDPHYVAEKVYARRREQRRAWP